MATFDDVLDKTKDAASVVAKKSQEAYNLTKKKISLADIKHKLQKNFADLGKLYYNAVMADEELPAKAESIIDEVSMLYNEIAELEDEILAIQNAVTCPKCGAKNSNENVFCSKCGAKL